MVYTTAEGTLMAAPFDLKRLEVTGPSVAVLEGIKPVLTSGAQFALSGTGTLLYKIGGGGFEERELVWVTLSGEVSPVRSGETITWARSGANDGLRLSPDGTRVAFTNSTDFNTDIWTKALPDGPMSRLTFDEASEHG